MSIKVPASASEESNSVIFSDMASKLYNETLNIQQLTKNYDLHVIDYAEQHILNEAFERLIKLVLLFISYFATNKRIKTSCI